MLLSENLFLKLKELQPTKAASTNENNFLSYSHDRCENCYGNCTGDGCYGTCDDSCSSTSYNDDDFDE